MSSRIINMPSRAPEIGRIRSGFKDDSGKMQPLRNWRCTSPDETAIKAISSIYGGEPQPWSERPNEWEVFTESDSINILLPNDALFTAYEQWGQGGNKRRCDGERCVVPVETPQGGELQEVDCICLEQGLTPGESKGACGVTVRLKVVLPDVPGFGIWLLTSGSIFAALELPFQVDTILAVTGALPGTLIPCELALDYREPPKKAWEKFQRRFSVPSLRVKESIARLQAQLAVDSGHHPRALVQTAALPSASGPGAPPGFEDEPAVTGAPIVGGLGDPPYSAPKGGFELGDLREIAGKHGIDWEGKSMSVLGKELKAEGLLA